jgi:hypothetical protein
MDLNAIFVDGSLPVSGPCEPNMQSFIERICVGDSAFTIPSKYRYQPRI